VLGHVLRVRSSQTNNCAATSIYNINSDYHRVLLVCGNLDSVEVLAKFSVYLLKDVGVYGNFGAVDCGPKDKLRYDFRLVQESFDGLFVFRITDYNDGELVLIEWEPIAMLNVSNTIALSAVA
jgi:hypothetical protein